MHSWARVPTIKLGGDGMASKKFGKIWENQQKDAGTVFTLKAPKLGKSPR